MTDEAPRKVLFTVGSVLRGDDAAGPMLAKMFEERPVEGWTVIDGGQTPEDDIATVRRMRPDTLVLVDAACMGLDPGDVRIVDAEDVAQDFLITTHSLPITFLLGELQQACGEVVFLGIQPAGLGFFDPLSMPVRRAIEDIHDRIACGRGFSDVSHAGVRC
ncbi:MAG: hydrogenase maturation peptidase HycI [Slackia sp.]|nr:hydrogenase maturation peptidase HycI [Slackia sp.]